MDLLSDLRNILPEEESVRADGGEVERHGDGMFTYHDGLLRRLASKRIEHGLPVVPFGQGSSLEG